MSQRIVLHLDMDAFFASVEEQANPKLKGQPLVIGSDPKHGTGRGVVSTANYAARAYGIHSAQPISIAWRLAEKAKAAGKPPAVFLEPNHKLYAQKSSRIMELIAAHSVSIEPASVDEAYFELKSGKPQGQNSKQNKAEENAGWLEAEAAAKKIKAELKEKLGLTASVGIGPNKLIAKIAAGTKKPDGLTIVRPDEVQEFLDAQPVGVIPGIGPKTRETLLTHRVESIYDLRRLSREKLESLFGKWGSDMYEKARGIDESPIVTDREIKSIGEQETFDQDTLDPQFLLKKIQAMAERVAQKVEKEAVSFKTVGLVVRFEDFETKTRAHTLTKSGRDAETIQTEAIRLFMPFLDKRENPRKKKIRLLGVRVEKLSALDKSISKKPAKKNATLF